MIFYSDKFIYDNVNSWDIGLVLVTTEDKEVLVEYGVPFTEEIKVDRSYGGNPFYSHKQNLPEKIKLEFCLVDKTYSAIPWTEEVEEKIVNLFMQDKFCEFVTYDYPDLTFYLRGIKVSRKRNFEKKGVLIVEFQPYYSHPVRKIRKYVPVHGERDTVFFNHSQVKEFIYPIIKLECLEDGDFSITNKTYTPDKTLKVKGLKKGDKITIDNQLFIVLDDKGKSKFEMVNREWFGIGQGNNELHLTGNVKFEMDCNLEIRI